MGIPRFAVRRGERALSPERTTRRRGKIWLCAFAVFLMGATPLCLACERPNSGSSPPQALREPDVPYEPSPHVVVSEMLKLAQPQPGEAVYDLGCGDGRIVIAAVRDYGARGVCIDIDPERIRDSRKNAEKAGVAHRIEFRTQDLFEADIRDADVVTLFLWPSVNLRLRPKLLAQLEPGARVVSYIHDMDDWRHDEKLELQLDGRQRPVYLWRIR